MSTFDPAVPCRVHDQLNDSMLDWKPEWAEDYRKYGVESERGRGVISWDGLLLDGWIQTNAASRKGA